MGYIKMHRDIQEWEWYGDPKMVAFWLHLLINANWADKEWRGETIGRGQLVASVASLSLETGLSVKEVRTALSRLVKSKYIVTEGASQWTKITVCNYDSYYIDEDTEGRTKGKPGANEGQTKGEQRATNKEYKEGKEGKERKKYIYSDSVERIYALYPSSTKRPDGNTASLRTAQKDKDKIDRLLSSGRYTEESLSYAIRRYLSEAKPEYLKQFQTFLNQIPDYSEDSVFRRDDEVTEEEKANWIDGRRPQRV